MLFYVVGLLCAIAIVAGLILYALRNSIDLYYTPTQLYTAQYLPKQQIRIGGMVALQSIVQNDLQVSFILTDYTHNVTVNYVGLLPDLFKEGQGAVVAGKLNADNIFVAKQILAKHDENYMPR